MHVIIPMRLKIDVLLLWVLLKIGFGKKICEHFKCEEYIPLQYDDNRRDEIINFF